jgi:hypothetical protein
MNKIIAGLMLILLVSGCAPAAGEPGSADAGASSEPGVEVPEVTTTPSAEEAQQPIVIDAADACSLLSEEQVEAAFGAEVVSVTPQTEAIGTECEYEFGVEGTQLRVTFYNGDPAKQYFATLVAAAEESCDAFFAALFSAGMSEGTGQDLSATPLEDLYRQYTALLGNCMYAVTEPRADVAPNVDATETIAFNWSSSLAVLGLDRVVEFTYQENLPPDVEEALSGATDKESTYAIAGPYRDEILTGYTEILLQLLQQATD